MTNSITAEKVTAVSLDIPTQGQLPSNGSILEPGVNTSSQISDLGSNELSPFHPAREDTQTKATPLIASTSSIIPNPTVSVTSTIPSLLHSNPSIGSSDGAPVESSGSHVVSNSNKSNAISHKTADEVQHADPIPRTVAAAHSGQSHQQSDVLNHNQASEQHDSTGTRCDQNDKTLGQTTSVLSKTAVDHWGQAVASPHDDPGVRSASALHDNQSASIRTTTSLLDEHTVPIFVVPIHGSTGQVSHDPRVTPANSKLDIIQSVVRPADANTSTVVISTDPLPSAQPMSDEIATYSYIGRPLVSELSVRSPNTACSESISDHYNQHNNPELVSSCDIKSEGRASEQSAERSPVKTNHGNKSSAIMPDCLRPRNSVDPVEGTEQRKLPSHDGKVSSLSNDMHITSSVKIDLENLPNVHRVRSNVKEDKECEGSQVASASAQPFSDPCVNADPLPDSKRRRLPRVVKERPPYCRLFIGNLAAEFVSSEELEIIFQRYGPLIEEPVVRRSFGFVQYGRPEHAAAALASEQGRVIGGIAFDLKIADNRDIRKGSHVVNNTPYSLGSKEQILAAVSDGRNSSAKSAGGSRGLLGGERKRGRESSPRPSSYGLLGSLGDVRAATGVPETARGATCVPSHGRSRPLPLHGVCLRVLCMAPQARAYALHCESVFREKTGLTTEMIPIVAASLGESLRHALGEQLPYVVVVASKDVECGTCTIRSLEETGYEKAGPGNGVVTLEYAVNFCMIDRGLVVPEMMNASAVPGLQNIGYAQGSLNSISNNHDMLHVAHSGVYSGGTNNPGSVQPDIPPGLMAYPTVNQGNTAMNIVPMPQMPYAQNNFNVGISSNDRFIETGPASAVVGLSSQQIPYAFCDQRYNASSELMVSQLPGDMANRKPLGYSNPREVCMSNTGNAFGSTSSLPPQHGMNFDGAGGLGWIGPSAHAFSADGLQVDAEIAARGGQQSLGTDMMYGNGMTQYKSSMQLFSASGCDPQHLTTPGSSYENETFPGTYGSHCAQHVPMHAFDVPSGCSQDQFGFRTHPNGDFMSRTAFMADNESQNQVLEVAPVQSHNSHGGRGGRRGGRAKQQQYTSKPGHRQRFSQPHPARNNRKSGGTRTKDIGNAYGGQKSNDEFHHAMNNMNRQSAGFEAGDNRGIHYSNGGDWNGRNSFQTRGEYNSGSVRSGDTAREPDSCSSLDGLATNFNSNLATGAVGSLMDMSRLGNLITTFQRQIQRSGSAPRVRSQTQDGVWSQRHSST